MQKIKILLTTILIFLANFSYAQFNDCKEYGFKGKLKKVTTYNYIDLEKNNSKWIVDENKLISIWEFIIDENQNFKEIRVKYFSDDSIEIYTYKYEFKDNLKTSYQKFDKNKIVVETAKFEWLNDKTYNTRFDFENYTIENRVILNNSYRDFIGENTVYEIYENEKIPIEKTSYKNFFNSNGIIQKAEKYDVMGNITSTIKSEIQKLDNNGNMTEFAIIKDDEKLERFIKRTFEYEE